MFTERTADGLVVPHKHITHCPFVSEMTTHLCFCTVLVYRVSGIVPLCTAVYHGMGRRMRAFNATKLLCSGRYKRTPCISHSSPSWTLQMYKRVWVATVTGRQGGRHGQAFPPPTTVRSSHIQPSHLLPKTFLAAKWPRSEADREVTCVCRCSCLVMVFQWQEGAFACLLGCIENRSC